MSARFQQLANELPDVPRWVETRSMLLGGRAEVLGEPPDCVIWDAGARLLCVVGRPASIVPPDDAESVLVPERGRVDLTGWRCERATLYLRERDPEPVCGARLVLPEEAPPELSRELTYASSFSPIAGAFAGNRPVSFCYGVPTETLWDVSIDTIAEFRGQGYGRIAFEYMAYLMAEQGKRPVWGALESNAASHRLAAKLGFVAVDEVDVYLRAG